ncbi:TPA: hypothetical protein N0F65_012817 [Lagenidium giganteum]|uniref:Uncharacterized protein n=1 Tax=Lagenidium giganteum TaxID=4803 RepID=A0AAV2YAF1_9STRA|nr:TPA: hypothetical protein N0F65_012817 [Lagenidium giganteum]
MLPHYQLLPQLPDNYDVFWSLAQSPSHTSAERVHAWELVCEAMIVPDMVTDYRMLCYSTNIPHERFGIELFSGKLAVTEASSAIFTTHVHYFNRIASVITRTRRVRIRSDHNEETDKKFVVYARSLSAVDVDDRLEMLLNRLVAGLQSSIGLQRWNVDRPQLNDLCSIMATDIVERARKAAECIVFVARACTTTHEMGDNMLQQGFVEVLVDVLWATNDSAVGVTVASTLAILGSLAFFRARIIAVLGRQAREIPFGHRFMEVVSPLVQNEGKVSGNSHMTNFEARYRSQVSQFLLRQHRYAGECKRWCQLDQRTKSVSPAIASFAKRYSNQILDRVCAAMLCKDRVWKDRVLKFKDSVYPVAVRSRNASIIQLQFWRWMYATKRPNKRVLHQCAERTSCRTCGKSESLLATLLRALGDPLYTDTSVQNDQIDLLVDAITCIRLIVLDHHVCDVMVRNLHLDYSLLLLTSHDDVTLRSAALSTLAETCWNSTAATTFVVARLKSNLWNVSTWNANTRCSWIYESLGKFRSTTVVAESAQTSQERQLKCATQTLIDLEAMSSMLLIVSSDGSVCSAFLRVLPIITKSLRRVYPPYLPVRLLVALQNVLLLTESATVIDVPALAIKSDLAEFLNPDVASCPVARTMVVGLLWTVSLRQRVRRHVHHDYPETIRWLVALCNRTIKQFRGITDGSHLSTIPLLVNIIGALATITIEDAHAAITIEFLSQLQELYSFAKSGIVQDECGGRAPLQDGKLSSWAAQYRRFGLVPFYDNAWWPSHRDDWKAALHHQVVFRLRELKITN